MKKRQNYYKHENIVLFFGYKNTKIKIISNLNKRPIENQSVFCYDFYKGIVVVMYDFVNYAKNITNEEEHYGKRANHKDNAP